MDFFIKETNVRGGNRGGKNLFNWDDIRLLPNRERQSYLGATQALGLMDKGGKWYRRDWWTHYNSQVNVYGQKDKLNNRSALLEEQKEIRQKEKEKLYEFLYGKKKKNNLNMSFNDGESVREKMDQIELDNKSIKSGFSRFSRPGLGMKNQINLKNKETTVKNNEKEDEKFLYKNTNSIREKNTEIKKNEENIKERERERHSYRHHHSHHHKHHHSNKSRSRSRSKRNKSRSRSKDNIRK